MFELNVNVCLKWEDNRKSVWTCWHYMGPMEGLYTRPHVLYVGQHCSAHTQALLYHVLELQFWTWTPLYLVSKRENSRCLVSDWTVGRAACNTREKLRAEICPSAVPVSHLVSIHPLPLTHPLSIHLSPAHSADEVPDSLHKTISNLNQ